MSFSKELIDKAKQIKIIAFDIDGTLTDGSIYMGVSGEELKVFNVKDGYALRKAEDIGLKVFFITGRVAYPPLIKRVEDLRFPADRLFDKVKDKVEVAESIVKKANLTLSNFAFMGDDILDLNLLKQSGLSGAPFDAVQVVKDNVDLVSQFNAGRGAAREFIDLILLNK